MTVDPLNLVFLNRQDHRFFFPEGDDTSEILEVYPGNKKKYKEVVITVSTSHRYFPINTHSSTFKKVTRDKVHKQDTFKSLVTGLSLLMGSLLFTTGKTVVDQNPLEVFTTGKTVVDHRTNLKTDWTGILYSLVTYLCNV